MKRSTTRWLNGAFFAAGLCGLAWLVHTIGLDAIGDGLSRVGPWFALVVAVHLAAILLDAVTLRACAGTASDKVPYRLFARASLAGHGVNQATPLGKLGEITKVTTLGEAMSVERATGALIVQNFVMFVVNCAIIGAGALVALLTFDVESQLATAMAIVGGAFVALGAGGLALMRYGVGDLPLRVARWFGVRSDAWWHETRAAWREAASSPRHMRAAFVANTASRGLDFVEAGLILYLLDVPNVIAATSASEAGYQVVYWATSFVPMQAGTAEGGAYLLFEGLGLAGATGVLLELVRRARRLVFIGIGVGIVGWQGLRDVGHTESP